MWPLALSLLAAAGLAYALRVGGLTLDGAPFEIPWWAFIAAFAVVDAFMVHLHFRREAHSFTLAELPLAFGLFFCDPLLLVPARLAGALIALTIVRRQRPVKLTFNLAVFALEACLALVVFHAISGSDLSWRSLLAALAALGTATVVGAAAVVTAISLTEGKVDARGLVRSVVLGLAVTAANASIGIIGVAIVWTDPYLAVLLLAPAGVLLVAYRAYLAERRRHTSLAFLYETTRELHHADDMRSAIADLLAATRRSFRCDVAELTLFPTAPGKPASQSTLGPGDTAQLEQPLEPGSATAARVFEPEDEHARVVFRHDGRRRGRRRPAATADAMVAPLRGDRRIIGRLSVRERQGDVRPFDEEDVRLFETLANHAGAALEMIQLADELKHLAFHDSLTNLPNRMLLHKRLQELVNGPAQHPGVLVLDLDDFKTINDSLGHAAGDELLVAVAGRLEALLRPGEHVARLAGDEFAVSLDDHDVHDGRGRLAARASAILDALTEPFRLEGEQISVTASLGIAAAASAKERPEELLRNADLAMYKAKELGKGRFVTFDATLRDKALRRLEVQRDLHQAFERNEFTVHYQPLVDLETGKDAALEALVRWQHPEHGLLHPPEFLTILEDTGLIAQLGRWVLREALQQTRAWQATAPDLGIAVNLSAIQLQRPELVDNVAAVLGETGIDPATVTLELTESAFLDDCEPAGHRLRALKQLGVRLAIDDFGTGYSSLGYLARFPLDVLKIARPFVVAIDAGTPDAGLAGAIAAISHSLGLITVAEGIETEEQGRAVRALGCQLGQGYFFSPPLSASAISERLGETAQHRGYAPGTVIALRRDLAVG
ncbi:MAG: EAL domain-containing protein [Gaiellaceae bacterium MAG52_C11]|nr:EAL domain-containing protein [Candidatus Gaiellasilicea maunaloa]